MRWSRSFWARSGAEMQNAATESTPVRIAELIESPRKGSGILALVAGDDAHSFRVGPRGRHARTEVCAIGRLLRSGLRATLSPQIPEFILKRDSNGGNA